MPWSFGDSSAHFWSICSSMLISSFCGTAGLKQLRAVCKLKWFSGTSWAAFKAEYGCVGSTSLSLCSFVPACHPSLSGSSGNFKPCLRVLVTLQCAEGFFVFSSKRIRLLKTGGRLGLGDCCKDNSLLAATYAAVAQNSLNKVCAAQRSASTLCQWKSSVGCRKQSSFFTWPFSHQDHIWTKFS